MRLSLKAKVAGALTLLVVAVVGAAEWDARNHLAGEYLVLLHSQQQSNVEQVAAELDAKIALHLRLLQLSLGDATNVALDNPADAAKLLASMGGTRSLFGGVGLFSLHGDTLAYDPPRPANAEVNVADRDYFKEVVASGRAAVSQPLVARTSGESVVVLAVPVRNREGELVGVGVGGLNLLRQSMLGELSRARVGETGYFVLRTRGADSIYISHPDPKKLLRPARTEPLRSADSGSLDVSIPFTARRPLQQADWDLEIVMPAAEALGPLERAQTRMLKQTLSVALLAALLIWITTFALFRPLTRLHRAVDRLPRGRGVLELPPLAHDEIGDLGAAFAAALARNEQAQAEMRAVHEASPVGLFHCDLDGKVTYANDAYLRIQGIPADQLEQGWQALLPETERAQALAAWREGLAEPAEFEARIRTARPDGAALLLNIRRAPVLIEGHLVGHVGAVEDITERVAHERAQRLLTAVFESTSDFIAQTDLHGRITYLNRAARERCGIALDHSLAGLTVDRFHPRAVLARLHGEILPIATERGLWAGETIGLDAEGHEIPLSHIVIAHRDRHGKVERFSGVMRDISAQKAASAELSRSEQTLRSMAEALPALVAVVNQDETYRYVNTAFGMWVGRAPEQIIGCQVRSILGEAEYAASEPALRHALAGEAVVFEKSYRRVDTVIFKEISFIPLRSGSGAPEGFVAIAADATARKLEESALREKALRDPLTGLLNRAGFEAAIAAMRAGQDGASGCSVLYIDLDHFKAVNDRHGHGIGDELLKAFAGRLRSCVRPDDPVCRLGGDEFAVLLCPVHSRAQADRVAAQVVETTSTPFQLRDITIAISASVGVANGSAQQSADELLASADSMLYEAKRLGRGRHVVAH
jgi:diguanylate cyclase (GGDEF)-like protein/PAS domain S-box-containing protein